MTNHRNPLSAVALACGLALSASTASAAPRTIDLAEALRVAEANNLDLKAATLRMERADLDVRQARVALMPNAGAQGKYTHNGFEAKLARPGGGEPVVIQQADAFDGSLRLSVPLVNAATWSNIDASKETVDAARSTFTATKTDLLLRVAQSFYAAAGADELLAARENAIALARQTLERAKARFEMGQTTQLDVSQAELALLRAETAADEGVQAQASAYRALGTLLQVNEPLRVKSDAIVASAAAARERAEVTALAKTITKAELQKETAHRGWLPTLSAFGLATMSNYAGFTGRNYAWSAGLQLDWSLFDGGLRNVQAASAESARSEAEVQLRLRTASIDDEVADARSLVETKGRSVVAADRAVALSGEALELARARYDAGKATQLDVLQAQDSLVQAQVTGARARFEVATATLAYERSIGVFLDRLAPPTK